MQMYRTLLTQINSNGNSIKPRACSIQVFLNEVNIVHFYYNTVYNKEQIN